MAASAKAERQGDSHGRELFSGFTVREMGAPEGWEKIAWECSRGPDSNMAESCPRKNRQHFQR
jgi:hypothetical protein